MSKTYLITPLVLLMLIMLGWLKKDMDSYLNSPLFSTPESLRYIVPAGTNFQALLDDLQARQIIKRPYYFEYIARRNNLTTRIQAGEYLIEGRDTPLDLLQQFATGRVMQYLLTLVEGWSFKQLMGVIANTPVLKKTMPDYTAASLLAVLGVERANAEGLFLPETYYFPAGTTDVDFLLRAHRALMQTLSQEWDNREQGLPYQAAYEALIMASLIEKETGLVDERARIAGVFIRRLQKSIKLQTDPTVIYAMGDHYTGNIRKKDLAINSLYNTYLHKGLPPTPIALASQQSIHAALHPRHETALYFVARGDGGHHFSSSLPEHNRAVLRYQLNRQRGDN